MADPATEADQRRPALRRGLTRVVSLDGASFDASPSYWLRVVAAVPHPPLGLTLSGLLERWLCFADCRAEFGEI